MDDEGIRLLSPESPKSIREAFVRAGSMATGDIVELYSAIGGMEIMDVGVLRVWPLKEVEKRSDRSSYGVLFADYLLDSWSFRLVPTSTVETQRDECRSLD